MRHPEVHIHYHRLPDRSDVYIQTLVLDHPEVKVTYQPETPLPGPMRVDGRVVLEPGSPAVWFTFPDTWHDIGRFHDAAGEFTGVYANILTPCRLHDPSQSPLRWDTTDLFLDVWVDAAGGIQLLDEDDLEAAITAGHVDLERAARARREAARIIQGHADGVWPPPVVEEWTLERVKGLLSP